MSVTCDTCGYLAQGEADYDVHDKFEDHPFTADDMEACHVTRVVPIHRGGFQPVCSICGHFGHPEMYWDDAQAIADRHAAIQGFER